MNIFRKDYIIHQKKITGKIFKRNDSTVALNILYVKIEK